MQDAIKPSDAADVAEAITSAAAGAKRLELVGRGSKRELGRATQTDATLDLSALSGITLYEPEELVLSARARLRSPKSRKRWKKRSRNSPSSRWTTARC